MKLIVFGGAGFIGSEFVRQAIASDSFHKVFVVDALTYAGNQKNLGDISNSPKFDFIHANILNSEKYENILDKETFVVNFAAESHVDRSIEDPLTFASTNFMGVCKLLHSCKEKEVSRFIQVSTDEVYGPMPEGAANEKFTLNPSSPYAASKAAGDLVALSFWTTYKFPVMITRGVNTFGPNQYPEKLIPLALSKLRNREDVPIYGDGNQTREWIHVSDHASGIMAVLLKGQLGEIYNIGTDHRLTNLQVIKILKDQLKIADDLIKFVEDRKGHDIRYALDSTKIQVQLNWFPEKLLGKDFSDFGRW